MFTKFRLVRAARVQRPLIRNPILSIQKVGFASENTAGKLTVSFSLPHENVLSSQVANFVNISTESGDMGVYADHSPFVHQLKPGIIEINMDNSTKKYFASSGFAVMNPCSSLEVFATEACSLDDVEESLLSKEISLAKAQEEGGKSKESNDAKIRLEVYESLQAALSKK